LYSRPITSIALLTVLGGVVKQIKTLTISCANAAAVGQGGPSGAREYIEYRPLSRIFLDFRMAYRIFRLIYGLAEITRNTENSR